MRYVFALALVSFALTSRAEAFPIGSGDEPAVAVDASGTAYVAWNGPDAQDTPQFCRLPRGATRCDVTRALPVAANTSSTTRPVVSLVGGRVSILVYRSGQFTGITQYVSSDGGATFASRTAAGDVPIYASADGPGDSVSVVTSADADGGQLTNVPLGAGTASGVAVLDAARPYNGAVGLDGSTPVVTFSGADDRTAFRRYSGVGDVNTASSWSAPVDIGVMQYPRLAGGAPGLFLLAGDGDGAMFVRRWSGAGFAAPVVVGPGDASESGLFVDGGGRVHAVFPALDAAGYHARYVVSDDGVTWTTATLADTPFAQPTGMRVAAAPDHVGVAVWQNGTQIELVPFGLSAAPPPGQPPPTPTPTPVPEPVPVAGQTVVATPKGDVRVRARGSAKFVALTALDDVPFGSTIDAKRGEVTVRAVNRRTGVIETVRLYDGMFRISQAGAVVSFTLNEPLASCARRARAAQKKPRSRKLWGDGKGAFRTSGKYSAATVRGTKWLVQDSCAGTLTRVTQGSVTVRAGKKTVVVRAGRRYLARPRR